MKAVVFHDIGDIRFEDVSEPQIKEPTDAIVRLTATAICGTDLHMIRGTMSGMEPGTVLGHEGVGIVEQVGPGVRNLKEGDRVVIPSTIACGYCSYCRAGYYAQCDNANPNGKRAGTAFFGGPKLAGAIHGLQAEKARIPFANVGPVKIDSLTDDEAILLSDIFPTGYFGADIAQIHRGHTVAVFGCGPVGQFAILSAKLFGAGRIFAIDHVPCRLEMARAQGAETIDFSKEDPVEAIMSLTGGIGVDRAIDAVGVDAESPHSGPAAEKVKKEREEYERELSQVAPRKTKGQAWKPGDAPSLALTWAVDALAKAGLLSVIGVYPQTVRLFPIGQAMMKNLRIHMGNCNHRSYIPMLVDLVQSGAVQPTKILTNVEPFTSIIDAYKAFDHRQPGWIKVELKQAA
ncbi:MAG: glutathione-dependent formaldehyde dehydrogenase [Candidatus Abyssobacteria bacterium SURF_5]|uniref:Glutathione-dependent formaldehyde dehydrogenase n=1 Tax=Abyssobacteria bacterium (strain SURF_5) TaxID=2093360 RepID=A0A3A4NL63_ABYX5|nr:MAG: glutathione-dependent formaldehyde dehydrogenase [Candidatus Abyssubacteria bacterium SURF_5]